MAITVHRITHSEGVILNHAPGAGGYDVTLCGLALEGDAMGEAGGNTDWSTAETVQGRITCPDCAKIIAYCKSIPAREINTKTLARARARFEAETA